MMSPQRIGRFGIRQLVKLMPLRMKRYLYRVCGQSMSSQDLLDAIMVNVQDKVKQLDGADALRFLFSIETNLYPLEGQQSIIYEGGVHTKHRHMKYHDFFFNRISANETVLDVGCGIGSLAHSIATNTGATIIGIDYNENNIQIAKQKYQADNIQYSVTDIYDYQPDRSFDVVVMSNVLEHLENRPELLRRIQQQTSAEKFLIRVPRFDRHWSVPLKKELGVEWRLDEDHKIEFTPETFVEEMRAANLTIEHIEYRWDEIWAALSVKS